MPARWFQQSFKLAPKGNNYEEPVKSKRSPQEGIYGEFHYQGRLDLAQKRRNSEVPAGQFLCSLQFLRRSKLAPKWFNSEVTVGKFLANRVWNSNMGSKFWVQGRVYQHLKETDFPLHCSLFFWSNEVERRQTFATVLITSVPPLDQIIALTRYQLVALLLSFLLLMDLIS